MRSLLRRTRAESLPRYLVILDSESRDFVGYTREVMHKAPVRESCFFEGEMGELRDEVSGENGSWSESEIIYLHVASHSQSSEVEEGQFRVVFAHDEHSFGKHQLFEIYGKTTSLFISSSNSNSKEKNKNSLEKRAISLV